MKTPKEEGPLVGLMHEVQKGVQSNPTLGLPADLGEVLTNDLAEHHAMVTRHNANKTAQRAAQAARRAALQEAFAFLKNVTNSQKAILGNRRTPGWEELGYTNGSLQVPESPGEFIARLNMAAAYFTAHSVREFPNAGVTAAKATELRDRLTVADADLNTAFAACRETAEQRAAIVNRMRNRVRSIYASLKCLVDAQSNTWYAFGFTRPIDRQLPMMPGKPTVTQNGDGMVLVTIPHTTRAKRYRVFVQSPSELEPTLVATVKGELAQIRGLPAAIPLKFTVAAANTVGTSNASEPVTVMLVQQHPNDLALPVAAIAALPVGEAARQAGGEAVAFPTAHHTSKPTEPDA